MKKLYDRTLFAELLDKKHIKRSDLAKAIGLTPQAFLNKVYGCTAFRVEEAYKLCKELDIPLEDMLKYFG